MRLYKSRAIRTIKIRTPQRTMLLFHLQVSTIHLQFSPLLKQKMKKSLSVAQKKLLRVMKGKEQKHRSSGKLKVMKKNYYIVRIRNVQLKVKEVRFKQGPPRIQYKSLKTMMVRDHRCQCSWKMLTKCHKVFKKLMLFKNQGSRKE